MDVTDCVSNCGSMEYYENRPANAAAAAAVAVVALLVTGLCILTVSSLYPHCILTVSSLYPYCIPVVVVVVAGGVIITYQNIVRRGKR